MQWTNQKLEVITCSWRKGRENEGEWDTIVFVFTSDGKKKWCDILRQLCSVTDAKPITFLHLQENRSTTHPLSVLLKMIQGVISKFKS